MEDEVSSETRTTNPTTLVLLPGLDGTEVFFQPLLASLPQSVRPIVVCLPTSGTNTYADLLATVRNAVAKIPECYVLGWSFSGPLALMLAVAEPSKVRGVMLAATFVRSPHPRLARWRFAACTPVIWTIRVSRRAPGWLWLRPSDPVHRAKAETWVRVRTRVIAARIRALLTVDAREVLRHCQQPILYLAGSHDRVVPFRHVKEITNIRPSVQVHTIEGRHMALYTNPEATVRVILEFVARRESAS
jgi:pimeloyl-[acyl-carrier protein] methyl ester esterase